MNEKTFKTIMRSIYLFTFMHFSHLLALFLLIVTYSSSSVQPLCHDDESAALLQFKESFIIKKAASGDPSAYSKVATWKLGGGDDCCSWDGIECDEDTGHVISLDLTSSCLYGSINSSSSLFRLVHLEWLSLADNDFHYSKIPSGFGNLSRLSHLNLSFSVFSGQIPSEILELSMLVSLDLSDNSLKLQKPGLRSLADKLTNLKELCLSGVNISSLVPHILANLSSKLTHLDLSDTNLYGDIPSSLGNLTQLTYLLLNYNQLTGQIPFCIGNLTQLRSLQLAGNQLHGPVPQSISRLVNLEFLRIDDNHLSGTLKFDLFLMLKNLFGLVLSYNNLSLLVNASINVTRPKLTMLGLSSCNLKEFPNFLRGQNELDSLSLSNNKIKGQIPKWMLNMETILNLELDSNYLSGFESFDRSPVFIPWANLRFLDLSFNKLQGSLPIPPFSIFAYDVSDNRLTGEIPSMICNLTSLFTMDLSNNNLSGVLPPCLGNLSNTVAILNLRNNHFHGTIPQTYMKDCKLRMIDFGQNLLQWKLPRSLANCTMLESLELANNQINDTFPSWLGILPQLKVLILRSNRFHGAIGKPKTNFEFPRLQIIDLSNNNFEGTLPAEYFQTWTAMKRFDANHLAYLQANANLAVPRLWVSTQAHYAVILTVKGMKREYGNIPEFLAAIDLSANRFNGEIPQVIGNLKALYILDLSNNFLTGPIPSSLVNLSELESLDLSQNQLSGEIPQQLSRLTFLAFLNVSYNRLTGPIPQGTQFDTFQINSFDGNPGLCGNPLSKKCGNFEASPPPPSSTSSPFEFDWTVVLLMGYACGLVVGVFAGHTVITMKHEWFMMTFGKRQQKMRRVIRRGHRN